MKAVKIILLSAAVVCLLIMVTPAMAYYQYEGWDLTNRVNGTVNGGVYFDSEPWDSTEDLTLTTDVPNGTVKYAFLYTGIWGANQKLNNGWINVTFNGNYTANGLGPIYLQGDDDPNPTVWASGLGKHWWWYNVTNLTNPGETNTARTYEMANSTLDGRVYGIVLVVVYEGGDDPKNISYWLNDACDALYEDSWPDDYGTTDFAGTVDNCSVTDASLTMVHLTAEIQGCADCLRLNNHILDVSMVDSNTFEMNTWDVTNYVESTGNDAWYHHGDDAYVSVTNAILVITNADTNITSCNETTGIEQNTFLPGENVSVHGGDLSAGTYKIWIQPDAVNASNKLLNATADPSGTQETVAVGESGCFGPIAIWNISESEPITFAEYDIVVDKQSDGVNTGNFSAHDGIDGACVEGFTAPVPELATVVLFGMGLLMLVGYVHLGRRRKRA